MSFFMFNDLPIVRTAAEDIEGTEDIKGFRDYISENWKEKTVRTGYPDLDDAIGGGLYPRLYVLGGATSTGKTTFALNLAYNIAKSGRAVLFFCMEMTRHEMTARCLSRVTFTLDRDNALTENEILYRAADLPKEKRDLLETAIAKFQTEAGKRLYFVEGRRCMNGDRGDPETVQSVIAEVTAAQKSEPGKEYFSPVVVIDYLQILRPDPGTESKSEKEQIDKHLDEIMKIKAGLETPVIVVSSYNRSSYYKDGGDNSSFKGSGEIEYSADGLFFLEMVKEPGTEEKWITQDGERKKIKVQEDPSKTFNKSMREDTRKIRLIATKNRGARYGAEAYFEYNPAYNSFTFGYPPGADQGKSMNETMKTVTKRNRFTQK